jgi:ferredoxin
VTYRISVDGDVCMSSGKCVADAPEVFRFDDDEIAELQPDAPSAPDARLLDLARACPAGALLVHDESGEEIDVF